MRDLIERMAKAAFDRMQGNLHATPEFPLGIQRMVWEDEPEELREEWRQSIRAALTEARKPTEDMVRAGLEESSTIYEYPHPRCAWPAMIDKALEP